MGWSTRSDVVNPVKDQGACGSCWALKTNNLYNLAEQQLVDCDKSSAGCSGGLSRYAFSGYYKSHGACSTSSYPYKASGGSCQDSSCSVKNWGESGHIRVGDTSSCSSGNFDMYVRTPIYPS